MIYENKPKVDELCRLIDSHEKLLLEIEGASTVEFHSDSGFTLLQLELEASQEEKCFSFLSAQAKYFRGSVVEKLNTEINRLKIELEKL